MKSSMIVAILGAALDAPVTLDPGRKVIYVGEPTQLEPIKLADAYKPRRRSKGEKARNRKGRWS